MGMEQIKVWFAFAERKTDFPTEIMAGIATFLSMLYLVVMIPAMFSRGGMDFGSVYAATILTSMSATLLMGIRSNCPIAVAPSIGISGYLAYAVIIAEGVPWQEGMGAALVAGSVLLVVSLPSLRAILFRAVPASLKAAVSVGLGFFVALIGLEHGRLVVSSPMTTVMIGDLSDPIAALTLFGIFLTLLLMGLGLRCAVFIGMGVTAGASFALGIMDVPSAPFFLPVAFSQTFGQLSLGSPETMWSVVLTLFLATLFETTGTMFGLSRQMNSGTNETHASFQGALLSSAIGSAIGALTGAGMTTARLESGTGVAAGGRTGFTSVVTAVLFGGLLFCAPIAKMLADIPSITAPALILSGAALMESVADINWKDYTEAFPAFFTLLLLPLSFSITIGLGVGFVLYAFLKAATGQGRLVHPLLYVLAVLFMLQFVF